MTSHWDHRIVRKRNPHYTAANYDYEPEYYYGIHEAYWNEDGSLACITDEPIDVGHMEDVGALRRTLSWMLKALDENVIDHEGPFAGFPGMDMPDEDDMAGWNAIELEDLLLD